jgi:hypothetical protein
VYPHVKSFILAHNTAAASERQAILAVAPEKASKPAAKKTATKSITAEK